MISKYKLLINYKVSIISCPIHLNYAEQPALKLRLLKSEPNLAPIDDAGINQSYESVNLSDLGMISINYIQH